MQISGTNISMIRGDSESIVVSCTIDGTETAFVDGDTVYFTVKKYPTDTEKVLQKIVTTFTGGKAYIDIAPSDTKPLEFLQYAYDIQISFADGTVQTVVEPSRFTILPEVTFE